MSTTKDVELASTFDEICLEDQQKYHLKTEPRPLYIDESTGIRFRQYYQEQDLHEVISLIAKDLSEPYSIYTYRYFIYNWPKLCILAFDTDKACVGTIVCKVEMHSDDIFRGYIAMLAVKTSHRRLGIGSRLAQLAIKLMIQDNCDEVVLETEVSNKPALALYEQLGFCRDERLLRYYLNGADAFRLKLWLKPLMSSVYSQLSGC